MAIKAKFDPRLHKKKDGCLEGHSINSFKRGAILRGVGLRDFRPPNNPSMLDLDYLSNMEIGISNKLADDNNESLNDVMHRANDFI